MASHKNHKIKQNSLPFSTHFILQSQGSAKNPRGHKITENELLMFPLYIYMYIVANLNHDWHSRPNSLSFNFCVAIDPDFFRVKNKNGRTWPCVKVFRCIGCTKSETDPGARTSAPEYPISCGQFPFGLAIFTTTESL